MKKSLDVDDASQLALDQGKEDSSFLGEIDCREHIQGERKGTNQSMRGCEI